MTDVRNFGFFVDVPGLAMSGLVHLSSLEDDFYVFDDSAASLVGRRTRRVIRLGDKVQVQVAKVDSFKKQVDFRLATEERKSAAPRPSARPFAPRPKTFAPEPKRPQPSPWKNSRPQDSRPVKSSAQGAQPSANKKPATFQTSGSKFSTTQRPLIKSSGAARFEKRRRFGK